MRDSVACDALVAVRVGFTVCWLQREIPRRSVRGGSTAGGVESESAEKESSGEMEMK